MADTSGRTRLVQASTPAATRQLGASKPVQPSEMRLKHGPIFVCMGPSGAGKTTMLETLNDTIYEPVCVLDADKKTHVLTDRLGRDIYICDTWDQLDGYVQQLLQGRLHPVYKTVCFDGTTAIQQVLSYNKFNIRKIDNPQLRQSAYGSSNLELVNLAQSARLLAEAGMHVIFNIWSVREKEEGTETIRVTPDLTPTMLTRFLGLFDYVVYLEPNNPPATYPPVMHWGGSLARATRTATSPDSPLANMPPIIYKPSWADIFDSYHGQPWPTDKHSK